MQGGEQGLCRIVRPRPPTYISAGEGAVRQAECEADQARDDARDDERALLAGRRVQHWVPLTVGIKIQTRKTTVPASLDITCHRSLHLLLAWTRSTGLWGIGILGIDHLSGQPALCRPVTGSPPAAQTSTRLARPVHFPRRPRAGQDGARLLSAYCVRGRNWLVIGMARSGVAART